MIEAKIIYSQRGDFLLMRSGDNWFISVLIPSFYPNSHFDASKIFYLTEEQIKHKDDVSYFKDLAGKIRKDWTIFADKEATNIKIVREHK